MLKALRISFGAFLAAYFFKKCTLLWGEAHFEVSRTLSEAEVFKKHTSLWREAHFEVKMRKTHRARITFGS